MDEPSADESEAVSPAKEKQSWRLLGIAVLIVLVVFIAFFLIKERSPERPLTVDELHELNLQGELDEDQGYIYNGFSFVYSTGSWFTKIRKGNEVYGIPLHYSPRDVEDIPIEGKLGPGFGSADTFYITHDSDDPSIGYIAVSGGELGVTLVTIFGVPPLYTCSTNESIDCQGLEYPVGGCELDGSVFYLRTSSSPQISLGNNCALIEGNELDLVRAMDKFLFVLYGIMEP
ncbi:MAG: hypothetical protein ABIH34_05200 [Nanoarchaeota archaeon]